MKRQQYVQHLMVQQQVRTALDGTAEMNMLLLVDVKYYHCPKGAAAFVWSSVVHQVAHMRTCTRIQDLAMQSSCAAGQGDSKCRKHQLTCAQL
jgi:hypothetical protein